MLRVDAIAGAVGQRRHHELKSFLGSVLHILGGKAARAYRRITVAVAMLDEADGFDQKVEKSSDPITLARGRLEGAPFPKLIAGSTPRVKGLSHVEYREEHADAP
jgi:phage terminase large subunit GpA-like protein